MAGYGQINEMKALLKNFRTVEELAVSLGRGPRTIFRYLDFLKKENCGLHKGKNAQGQTAFKIQMEEHVSFNQSSIKQLEKIKKNMQSATPSDVKNRKLLDKLIEAMQTTNPDEFTPEAIVTDRDMVLDYGPFSDDRIQDVSVNKILEAIHDCVKIRITYKHSTTKDTTETIEVSPVKVVMRIDTVYVIAAADDYPETKKLNNYLLENIQSITSTNHPALANVNFDLRNYYKYAFGKYTTNDDPQEIQLLLKPGSSWLKNQFEKSHFNPPAILSKNREKNDVVTFKIRVTPDFKGWLLGVLPNVQILAPESLKKEMKELVKKTLSEM